MHEYGIAVEMVRICQETLAEQDSTDGVEQKLESVRVLVGELSAIEPDLLIFAWEGATTDTELAGSRLEITWSPAKQVCDRCGREVIRETSQWHPNCAECGSVLRVEGGDELDILDLTIEESPSSGSNANAKPESKREVHHDQDR